MKRMKRHKIKTEKKEAYSRENEEHDLAYYIHDRVELMHQVFSVLKYKDLKAMAPESVRNLPIGDLQELCTEELLGISSKRLLATLDGCEPPSDTESSSASPSPDHLETISLDSISSDEEILSQSSKKKKHKHRRSLKSKGKKKEKGKDKSKETKPADDSTEVSQASRAGLTVLELLELQARARAIRAQLQNEQAKKQLEAAAAAGSDDDDEVEIKEETPDVVEISSGDEKPDINSLQAAVQQSPKVKEVTKSKETQNEKSKETTKSTETSKAKEATKSKEATKTKETTNQIEKPTDTAKDTQKQKDAENKNDTEKTVTTKRINDLIITVPLAKTTRKIKLNRNKVTVTVATAPEIIPVDNRTVIEKTTEETPKEATSDKKKKKKTKKKKNLEKEGSDHDEITLQLSDTEKMDLLEDLDDKNYQRVSSGTSDSSESSSSDSEEDTSKESIENDKEFLNKSNDKEYINEIESSEVTMVTEKIPLDPDADIKAAEKEKDFDESLKKTLKNSDKDKIGSPDAKEIEKENTSQCDKEESPTEMSKITDTIVEDNEKINDNLETMPKINENKVITEIEGDKKETEKYVEIKNRTQSSIDSAREVEKERVEESPMHLENDEETNKTMEQNVENEEAVKMIEINKIDDIPLVSDDTNNTEQESKDEIENKNEREISEGELSDRESSEVEAYDVQPEVVCISDDEKQNKKKKKKDKKAKKEKKSKKSKQDFREGADQNFYKDAKTIDRETSYKDDVDKMVDDSTAIDLTEDDVYEILELSDDSSCYEVEGTCLSKEPTTEEIVALSARIDEIKREDIEQTNINTPVEDNSPNTKSDASDTEVEQISWKDRYLDSKKVKRVLTTANILNALRKKNKDLKKKIADAKKIEMESQEEKVLEEGSIEHYQTLQASSKFVNPVTESTEETVDEFSKEDKEGEKDQEGVTREMKKDAKLLLKMYRKLMNNKKVKRREKKKKRKIKKKEESVPETADLM